MNRNIPNPPVYIGQPYSNVTSGPYAQNNTVIPQPYSNVTSGPYAQFNTVIPQPYSNVTSGPYAQNNINTVPQTTFTPQPVENRKVNLRCTSIVQNWLNSIVVNSNAPTYEEIQWLVNSKPITEMEIIDCLNEFHISVPSVPRIPSVIPTVIPTVEAPSENIDTGATQDPKYKDACRPQVPIICGEKTPQAGYCRRNEHDCNFKEWKSKSKGKVDSYIYQDKDMKEGDVYLYRPRYNAPREQSPTITEDEAQRQKVLNSFNKYLSNDEVAMKNKYLKYKEKYNALKALMDELEEAKAHEDELTQL